MSKSTFGQRLRQIRKQEGLTQDELARAISRITKSRASKSLVSQWERDVVANPQNATLLAIEQATGYSMRWLVHGEGPERVDAPPAAAPKRRSAPRLDPPTLRRALVVACQAHVQAQAIADAAAEVYEALVDDPTVPDSALRRIARLSGPTA